MSSAPERTRARPAGGPWAWPSPGVRVGAVVAAVLAAGTYIPALLTILLADRNLLVQSLPDDAFYCLEIGQRAAHGQGASFDGVSATNGFHPLWQVVVTGLARVASGDALLRAALVTGLLMALAGTVLLALAVRRAFGTGPALLALVVAMHASGAVPDGANAMESGAVVLCVGLVAIGFIALDRHRDARRAALLGAACGLLVMARLDFATVVWIVPLAAAWRTRWRRGAVCAAVGAAVCAPYVLWNALTFGHVLSVSGTVKQHIVGSWVTASFGSRISFAYLHSLWDLAGSYSTMLWRGAVALPADGEVVSLLLTVLCISGCVVLFRRRATLASGSVVVLASVVVMLAAKALVFSPFWAGSWYAAPQRTAAALLAGVLIWFAIQPIRQRLRTLGWAPVATIGLLFVPAHLGINGLGSVPIDAGNWQGADLLAAQWIVHDGPAGRYGSPDAGVLGFYTDGSHASVTDLDGLVNTYPYAALLARKAPPLQRYRSAGIDFLVARSTPGNSAVPQCSRLLWTSPGGIPYGGGLDSPGVTVVPIRIWDLRPCWTSS